MHLFSASPMTRFIAIACLVCLLSSTSCTSSRPHPMGATMEATIPPPPPPPPPHKARIASIEHRLSTVPLCRDSANYVYTHTGHTGPAPSLLGTPANFPIYSWRRSTTDSTEIRFIVQPTGNAAEPTNTVINYWDIEKKTGNDKDDLDKAYKKLKDDRHCIGIHGPQDDPVNANGKLPVRAIMQTTAPIPPPEDSAPSPLITATQLSGRFGIIINPPYP